MRFKKLADIPMRQIALKSGVDQRTVAKYFKGEFLRYSKEITITKSIREMLIEIEELKQMA